MSDTEGMSEARKWWIGTTIALLTLAVALLTVPNNIWHYIGNSLDFSSKQIVYSGRMTVTTAKTDTFEFSHADSSSSYVTFNPWTYTVSRDGRLEVKIEFKFPAGTSYASCAVVVLNRKYIPAIVANPVDHTSPGTGIKECVAQGIINVAKGEKIQAQFGQALPSSIGNLDVSGVINIEYID